VKTPDEFAQAMAERKADPSKVAQASRPDPTSRSVGLILCVAGLLGFACYYLTISQAQSHVHDLFYSWKALLTAPAVFLVGAGWVILGEKGSKVLGPAYSPTHIGWTFYGTCVVISIICFFAVGSYLQTLGYDVGM
jgi:drug/metabolite transporter (DMT)-like permease